MKLGEGGEAFFVFETAEDIPESLQTSPLVSPVASPKPSSGDGSQDIPDLQEPDYLDLSSAKSEKAATNKGVAIPSVTKETIEDLAAPNAQSAGIGLEDPLAHGGRWLDASARLDRARSEELLSGESRRATAFSLDGPSLSPPALIQTGRSLPRRSQSPPPLSPKEAYSRAISLSKKLSGSNIPSRVTETGDLMLDMTGYKSSEEDALRAEVIARKLLAEELEGNYDIGALIGADEHGNLWIYSSEEAKETASRRAAFSLIGPHDGISEDAVSDPGYHSESEPTTGEPQPNQKHIRSQSDVQRGYPTPPQTPPARGEAPRNYAKTLRLTSDQLKALNLKPGPNPMTFSVNKATCPASMYLWDYKTPIVISDIDGTITKSVLLSLPHAWTI
jgi:phosphatidate phosphatase LPIN